MRLMRLAVWILDESLDLIPAYEQGRWYRYGQWGCRLHLWKFWWPLDDNEERRDHAG